MTYWVEYKTTPHFGGVVRKNLNTDSITNARKKAYTHIYRYGGEAWIYPNKDTHIYSGIVTYQEGWGAYWTSQKKEYVLNTDGTLGEETP